MRNLTEKKQTHNPKQGFANSFSKALRIFKVLNLFVLSLFPTTKTKICNRSFRTLAGSKRKEDKAIIIDRLVIPTYIQGRIFQI